MMVTLTATKVLEGASATQELPDAETALRAIYEACGDDALLMRPKTALPYVLSRDGLVRIDGPHLGAIMAGEPLPGELDDEHDDGLGDDGEPSAPEPAPPSEVPTDRPPASAPSADPPAFEMPSARAKRDDLLSAVAAWNARAPEGLVIVASDDMKNAEIYEALEEAVELANEG